MNDPYGAYPDVQPVAPAPIAAQADPYAGYADVRMPPPMQPRPGILQDLKDTLIGHPAQAAASQLDMVAPAIGLGPLSMLRQAANLVSGGQRAPMNPASTTFQGLTSEFVPQSNYQPKTAPGQIARTAIDYAPAAMAPGSALARAANVVVPTLASEGAGQAAHAAGAPQWLEQGLRALGGVAGGALASVRVNPEGLKAPDVLPSVRDARVKAYGQVEAAGDVIPKASMRGLASDVDALIKAKAGPDGASAYPASYAMASRLRAMAQSKSGVTLPQLDTLRSDIYDATIAGGDREKPLGIAMRQLIDGAIDATGNTNIRAARDLYGREQQIQEIQNEVQSARQRAATANSGQNVNNSIRQELRPLIDPTRRQQMTNLSDAQHTALTEAVMGTKSQNAMRDASNILRNKFLQGALAVPTVGAAPAGMEIIGRVLNHAAEQGTMRNVQRVLDMIAAGRPGSAAPPITAAPRPPLISAPTPYAGVAPLLGAGFALSSGPAKSAPAQRRPLRK